MNQIFLPTLIICIQYMNVMLQVHVGVNTKYIHIIGHSLGAHLSGYIGNTLKTRYGLTLGRITGNQSVISTLICTQKY